jgi:hypothetical protein
MAQFRPQAISMTRESIRDYEVERYGVKSEFKTERFKTYAELKKALPRILSEHIGDTPVTTIRSRRGHWGEWFEKWIILDGKPTIIKKGWQ